MVCLGSLDDFPIRLLFTAQFTWLGGAASACECGAKNCKGILGRPAAPAVAIDSDCHSESEDGSELKVDEAIADLDLVVGTLMGGGFGPMRRRPVAW